MRGRSAHGLIGSLPALALNIVGTPRYLGRCRGRRCRSYGRCGSGWHSDCRWRNGGGKRRHGSRSAYRCGCGGCYRCWLYGFRAVRPSLSCRSPSDPAGGLFAPAYARRTQRQRLRGLIVERVETSISGGADGRRGAAASRLEGGSGRKRMAGATRQQRTGQYGPTLREMGWRQAGVGRTRLR